MVVDSLAENLGTGLTRLQSKALVGQADLDGRRIILVKPQTYMNLSGQAVVSLLRFYKVPVDHLLVVHDELDIPFGHLRLRKEGGSSGARGMASIIERLGSKDFPRLRVGIGRPNGRKGAADYVLEDFTPGEQQFLPEILKCGVSAVKIYVTDGIEAAMNRFNGPVIKD
jgi:PTH1 family peptidyl-tRNA hydrolase